MSGLTNVDHVRVCVIGAGPAGLATIKNLAEAGIDDILCHEAQDSTGGIWAYSDDAERPSVYQTAHTITSKRLSQFPDFPMPDDYPDYPSNRQILAYMRAYETHFGLTRYIRFKSKVADVAARKGGGWTISYEDSSGKHAHTADYLIVSSGHHREPSWPELPGDFSGAQLHSAHYKNSESFAGKRVLVVGGGNSACDIAGEISRVADHVSLSIRSPQVIFPKIVGGRPVDVQLAKLQKPRLRWARDFILKAFMWLAVGPYQRYGLQQPNFPILSRHPTLNTAILDHIRHGRVMARPGIRSSSNTNVTFVDGSDGDYDVIIWATGFKLSVPYLNEICGNWPDSIRLPLYLKMMLADVSDVFFIGLIQPIGCIWVIADLQAKVAAAAISGAWQRPDDIAARIEREAHRDAKRYKASPRHAVQVDGREYSAELENILRSARR
ncbi:NAD(P)-binding domain-containing protein [Hoeflea sp. G2-23]|uniref:Trimethylamine monooxygenase n=1 Tax=Hoeflea algicola TaxID=2983763 RepID=A0ABT3Z656_9HYPH|nr:NAD(P)-binding domain-containing protein [Hoeflea algicola]MCY0147252.1 NAD(P)-binding domain-containing protein [Hoeflea algicola]